MKRARQALTVALLVAGVSAVQYLEQGHLSWPADAFKLITGTLKNYLGRPEAGWRQAANAIEKLGEAREGDPIPDFDLTGRVVRVPDGDTFSLLDRQKNQHKIRLYGVDTPERDQPYGTRASAALSGMISGKAVGVVIEDTDQFGRSVGRVYLNGINVNLAMVQGGHAWWYRRHAQYSHQLAAAEKIARERRLGLWAAPEPVPPWDWRRRARYSAAPP